MSYAARVSLQADAAEAQEMTAQIIYGTDFAAKRERESAEMEVASEALGANPFPPEVPPKDELEYRTDRKMYEPAFPIHTGKEPA